MTTFTPSVVAAAGVGMFTGGLGAFMWRSWGICISEGMGCYVTPAWPAVVVGLAPMVLGAGFLGNGCFGLEEMTLRVVPLPSSRSRPRKGHEWLPVPCLATAGYRCEFVGA